MYKLVIFVSLLTFVDCGLNHGRANRECNMPPVADRSMIEYESDVVNYECFDSNFKSLHYAFACEQGKWSSYSRKCGEYYVTDELTL